MHRAKPQINTHYEWTIFIVHSSIACLFVRMMWWPRFFSSQPPIRCSLHVHNNSMPNRGRPFEAHWARFYVFFSPLVLVAFLVNVLPMMFFFAQFFSSCSKEFSQVPHQVRKIHHSHLICACDSSVHHHIHSGYFMLCMLSFEQSRLIIKIIIITIKILPMRSAIEKRASFWYIQRDRFAIYGPFDFIHDWLLFHPHFIAWWFRFAHVKWDALEHIEEYMLWGVWRQASGIITYREVSCVLGKYTMTHYSDWHRANLNWMEIFFYMHAGH